MKISEMVRLDKKPSQKVPSHLRDMVQQTAKSIADEWGNRTWHDNLRDIWERNQADVLQNKILRDRVKVFEQMGTLPKELELPDKNDPLSIAAHSPRVQLSEIRRVADELSFLSIPFEYMSEEVYKSAPESTQSAIQNFYGKMRGFNHVYVLCPPICYNVAKHINSERDLPIYAGKDNQQAFMAISMMVPIHRSTHAIVREIGNNIGLVTKKMVDMESQQAIFEEEMRNRLSELSKQSTIRTTERAKQSSKINLQEIARDISQAISRLSSAIASMFVSNIDPLMFAIPKNVSINDDSLSIVGPCWGGEFDDIAMSLLGFKKNQAQRKMIDESAGRWANA